MSLQAISELSRRAAVAGVAIAALLTGAPLAQDTRWSASSSTPRFAGLRRRDLRQRGPVRDARRRVFGELDPFDKHNDIINDLELAPRNSRGKVEYWPPSSW